MAYIGKEPAVGNFQVCDAISVVNGQAAYTLQVSSTNVVPESANHMLVSLNGILQKPNSSFTVSGSTITFASNLATGDVIDFVMLLGSVLNIGTPSDSTVTNAKTNFVSTSSGAGLQIKGDGTTDGTLQLNCSQNSHGIKLASPAHSAGQSYTLTFPTGNVTAEKFLRVASVSGSGTTGIGQLDFADAGGGAFTHLLTTTASDSANISFSSTYITTTYVDYRLVFSGVRGATDGQYPQIHASEDNGSSYSVGFRTIRQSMRDNANTSNSGSGTDGAIYLIGAEPIGTASNERNFSGFMDIYDPLKQNSTTSAYTLGQGLTIHMDQGGKVCTNEIGTAAKTNNAINNLKFSFTSGNITSGKVSLYGRKIS